MKIKILALAILLNACAPDEAPPAPEVPYDDEQSAADLSGSPVATAPSHNKHGWPCGADCEHPAQLQIQYGPSYEWCSSGPAGAGSCMKTINKWYESQFVHVNNTGRVLTISKVVWDYGWNGLSIWGWNPANFLICIQGVCADLANSQSGAGGGPSWTSVRTGTSFAFNGVTIPAWGWGVVDMAIRPRSGNATPLYYPQMTVQFWYKDGP